jgi:hypothetical protein
MQVNIAVAKDVAEELAKVAEERGMTQFALASELLRLGLELVKNGYDSQQVRELLMFYKIMTEPASILPASHQSCSMTWLLILYMSVIILSRRRPGIGTISSSIKALFGDLKDVAPMMPYLAKILPSKRFDVNVTENSVVIDVVGIGYGIESVQVNAVAARCLLEEFGYKVEKVIIAPGVLKIETSK